MNKRITMLLIILAAVLLGFLGMVLFNKITAISHNTSIDNYIAKSPGTRIGEVPDDVALWQNYSWNGELFRYPPGWKLSEDIYKTPLEESNGDEGSVVGFAISPVPRTSGNDLIIVGGKDATCGNVESVKLFKCIDHTPITSNSTDPVVAKVFTIFTDSIKKQ